MKWNDFTLLFLWILISCMTFIFWQNNLEEELFYQRLLLDRNLDTIAEDALYASIEGICDDFEPIIHTDYLLEVFEKEKNWVFGNTAIEIPFLFLTEKEEEQVYSISKGIWETYPISGYGKDSDKKTDSIAKINSIVKYHKESNKKAESMTESSKDYDKDTYVYSDTLSISEVIQRTDEIQEILMKKLNKESDFFYNKIPYQIYLPYIEQDGKPRRLEKTGLWYPFFSKKYQANGKIFDFFTYSGARCSRKRN